MGRVRHLGEALFQESFIGIVVGLVLYGGGKGWLRIIWIQFNSPREFYVIQVHSETSLSLGLGLQVGNR